jgi:Flp pilus assembly secretin CpaC
MKHINFFKIASKVGSAGNKFARPGWLITMLTTVGLVIFLSGQLLADAPAINVAVETGQSQILTLGSDIREAAISNTDIADIRVMTPRKLLIIGKNPGSTNLILWDAADQTTFFNLDVAHHQHQQVVLQVRVAEIGRSALRDLGVNFSSIGPEWAGAKLPVEVLQRRLELQITLELPSALM